MMQGRKTTEVCDMANYITQSEALNKYLGASQAEWECYLFDKPQGSLFHQVDFSLSG